VKYAILSLLMLTGCHQKPVAPSADTGTVDAAAPIFTTPFCKIYKFHDGAFIIWIAEGGSCAAMAVK